MRTRENKCQISQNDILHIKFFKFQLCLKFDTYFLSARLKTSLFKTSYLKGGGGDKKWNVPFENKMENEDGFQSQFVYFR